jgi:hypothetical protein
MVVHEGILSPFHLDRQNYKVVSSIHYACTYCNLTRFNHRYVVDWIHLVTQLIIHLMSHDTYPISGTLILVEILIQKLLSPCMRTGTTVSVTPLHVQSHEHRSHVYNAQHNMVANNHCAEIGGID